MYKWIIFQCLHLYCSTIYHIIKPVCLIVNVVACYYSSNFAIFHLSKESLSLCFSFEPSFSHHGSILIMFFIMFVMISAHRVFQGMPFQHAPSSFYTLSWQKSSRILTTFQLIFLAFVLFIIVDHFLLLFDHIFTLYYHCLFIFLNVFVCNFFLFTIYVSIFCVFVIMFICYY